VTDSFFITTVCYVGLTPMDIPLHRIKSRQRMSSSLRARLLLLSPTQQSCVGASVPGGSNPIYSSQHEINKIHKTR